MFDIFQQEEQPKLYIANIIVIAKIPSRGKKVRYEDRLIRLDNYPIVLLNGKLPTSKSEERFFKKIYNDKISVSDFTKVKLSIKSIENIRYSSNLMYQFDYNLH